MRHSQNRQVVISGIVLCLVTGIVLMCGYVAQRGAASLTAIVGIGGTQTTLPLNNVPLETILDNRPPLDSPFYDTCKGATLSTANPDIVREFSCKAEEEDGITTCVASIEETDMTKFPYVKSEVCLAEVAKGDATDCREACDAYQQKYFPLSVLPTVPQPQEDECEGVTLATANPDIVRDFKCVPVVETAGIVEACIASVTETDETVSPPESTPICAHALPINKDLATVESCETECAAYQQKHFPLSVLPTVPVPSETHDAALHSSQGAF